MGKRDLKQAATKHSQNLGDIFKRKKVSATSTLIYVADPLTNVVDQSVDSSASTTLTPEVNIDIATTEASGYTQLWMYHPLFLGQGILPQQKIHFLQQKQQPLQL